MIPLLHIRGRDLRKMELRVMEGKLVDFGGKLGAGSYFVQETVIC